MTIDVSPRLAEYARRANRPDMLDTVRAQEKAGVPAAYVGHPEDAIVGGATGRAFPLWMEVLAIVVVLALLACTGYAVIAAGSDANWQW